MAAETREIRRLVLRSRREHVRRAAFLVEDGLRTATLAGSGRGLVIVRSLALGCVDPRDPPTALSRRIEERWKEAERIAVPGGGPEAPRASAVRFESREQAFAIYMTERLAGGVPDAWYWKRILPEHAEDLPAGDLFTALALALVQPPAGVAPRIAAFVEHIDSRGALLPLADAVDDRCAAPVLRVLLPGVRIKPVRDALVRPARTHPEPRRAPAVADAEIARPPFEEQSLVAPPFRAVLRSLARRVSHSQAAALFAAVAILCDRPWLATAPETLARRVREIVAQAHPSQDEPAAEHSPAAEARAMRCASERDQPRPERGASSEPPPSRIGVRPPAAGESAVPEQQPATADTPRQQAAPAGAPSPDEMSSFAGLFFLLPVLDRLGLEKSAAEHPLLFEAGLLPALLCEIACAAGAKRNDPVLAALDYTLPEDSAPEFLAAVTAWSRRVHRYVRREAKLLVRWVVHRRGRICFTRTHIDVYFDVEQADVRLRRLGLDIDPGWVPALGKVIAYRYGGDES